MYTLVKILDTLHLYRLAAAACRFAHRREIAAAEKSDDGSPRIIITSRRGVQSPPEEDATSTRCGRGSASYGCGGPLL